MKDGIIVVNKPKEYTSRDVVNKICKILNTRKVGHAGTLDPLATGVLVVAINMGLKTLEFLENSTKEYIAKVKLGIKTDTLDVTGNVLEEKHDFSLDKRALESILLSFKGTYMQEVPLYSSVRVNGKRLYKYARENEEYPSLKLALKIRKMEKDLLSAMTSSNTQTQAKHEANQNKLKEKALQDAIKFSKLTRKNATVLSDKTFDVIYADFSNVATPLKDLSQLSIPANDNSVLLAWTDNKNLSKILCLVQNLGFEYQESLVWNYMVSSGGKFIKNQHKQLLICTKGDGLKSEYQEASVLNLHKNEEVDAKNHYYALIEQMFPEGAYLDMFASEKHNSKWALYSETTNNAAIEEN